MKARLSLLPPREKRVETVSFTLPGHESVLSLHLRVPSHPEFMRILEERDEKAREWCGPDKNWYPSVTGQSFPVTRTLLAVAVLIFQQQCTETGAPLPAEDAYAESELLDLCGSSIDFLDPFLDKFNEYLSVLEPDPKNSSVGGADS